MYPNCSELSRHVPVRIRVAFALAIAERVLPGLTKNTEGFNAARKALDDCWRWVMGERVRALQLYEDDDEALVLQGSLVQNGEESAALNTVTSAFYFALWQAFRLDMRMGLVRPGEVPMMGEVTEEILDEVCKSATQTSLCGDDWIDSVLGRLQQEFYSQNPEELGPTISRDYFVA